MELPAFIEQFPSLLWRASWQASVLVLLVLAAQRLCGRRLSPRWRYSLWLLVVVRLLLPVTPPSPWSVFNFNYGSVEHFTASDFEWWTRGEAGGSGPQLSSHEPAEVRPPSVSDGATSRQTAPPSVKPTPKPASSSGIQSAFLFLRQNVAWIWFLGVLALSMRLAWGNYLFGLQLRRRKPIAEPGVLELFEECRKTMGIRRSLKLLEAPELDGPALFGCFRLKLLLPEKMIESFSPSELRHVFLHELAHIRRWDAAVNWLTTILQTLHWVNPVLWFAFHRMRADRELACDELALARANEAESKPYGQTVIKVLEGFTGPTAIPGLVGILEDKTQIKRRIHMIAQFKKTSPWPVMAGVLVIALGLVSLTDAQTRKGGNALPDEQRRNTDSTTSETSRPTAAPLAPTNIENNAAGLTIRQMKVPDDFFQMEAAVSADGRYLARYNEVFELATGAVTPLPNWGAVLGLQFSPDGKRISAGGRSTNHPPHVNEVVVMDLENNQSRRLYRNEQITNLHAMDWSPDGRKVLFIYMKLGQNRKWDLATVSVSDGTAQVLKSLDRFSLSSFVVNFSPDGRWIVYDTSQTENEDGPRDLFLLSADGSQEIHLVQHPADDHVLGWGPFGNRILFGSNRRGTWDAYTLQVADGKAAGEPQLVKEGFGRPRPFGFTKDGAFVYRLVTDISDVYLAELDPASGNVQGKPSKMPHRYDGYSSRPAWSPDARFLAFISSYGAGSSYLGQIYVREIATGRERPLETPERRASGVLAWSPDSRTLLNLSLPLHQNRHQFVHVDVQSGAVTVLPDTTPRPNSLAGWAPDGRAFYYAEYAMYGIRAVIRYELQSGAVTPIPLGTTRATGVVLSPDGGHLAFWDPYFYTPGAEDQTVRLKVMVTKGGPARELLKKTNSERFSIGLAWSRDSRFVFYCKESRADGQAQPTELWRISAQGGEPEKLGVIGPERKGDGEFVDWLAISPDGRKAAFNVGSKQQAVWLMENFLPKDNVAVK